MDDLRKDSFKSIKDCIKMAAKLDARMVILPLLEASNLVRKNFHEIAKIIKEAAYIAKQKNIFLCIESLVSANELNDFISLINMDNVKAVFDTGNRVLETPDLYSEILILSENIGHIHIKDKDRFGNNVILGSGMVDFCGVFDALKKVNFCGALNFETNRGSVPLNTARHNIKFCEFFLENSKNNPILIKK
jgi:sugar phosphate isomerase/epimerase